MAENFDLKLIPEFSGADPSQSIVEWIEKAELVCRLCSVRKIECVVPMRLTGGAFAVYQQLSEDGKRDYGYIKDALLTAFAMDSCAAYAQFVMRRLRPNETVDVFLAELRKLSVPFEGMTKRGLEAAFVHGLPDYARRHLRASSRMEEMDIHQLLARARAILRDNQPEPALITAAMEPTRSEGYQIKTTRMRCYECDGLNHLARDCLVRRNRLKDRDPKLRKRDPRCSQFQDCPGKESGDNSYTPASSPNKM